MPKNMRRNREELLADGDNVPKKMRRNRQAPLVEGNVVRQFDSLKMGPDFTPGYFKNHDLVFASSKEEGGYNSSFTVRSGEVVVEGGRYTCGLADDEEWRTFHDAVAILAKDGCTHLKVIGAEIGECGDGIRFPSVNSFEIRGVYAKHCGDDAVENDTLRGGLIQDCLFDWCWVFLSCRLAKAVDPSNFQFPKQTIEIRDSLIRLYPQKGVNKPDEYPAWGHNGFFKWDGTVSTPYLKIHNCIFYAHQKAQQMSMTLNPKGDLIESSGNTLVWLGEGEYPEPLPEGFTLTRDRTVFESARAAWLSQHGFAGITLPTPQNLA
jgi:hypothetical protein